MIEENPRNSKEVVALPVVDGDVMGENLRHTIRAAWVEGRFLILRRFPNLAEHLTRGSLVNADGFVDLANRLQYPGDALRVELAREQRLVPRRRYERHRREVV